MRPTIFVDWFTAFFRLWRDINQWHYRIEQLTLLVPDRNLRSNKLMRQLPITKNRARTPAVRCKSLDERIPPLCLNARQILRCGLPSLIIIVNCVIIVFLASGAHPIIFHLRLILRLLLLTIIPLLIGIQVWICAHPHGVISKLRADRLRMLIEIIIDTLIKY